MGSERSVLRFGRFNPGKGRFFHHLLNPEARVVPVDRHFLCDKAAVLGAAIKETPCMNGYVCTVHSHAHIYVLLITATFSTRGFHK